MNVVYLNLEDVLRLHFQLVKEFGGSHGVRDESCLMSVIEAPKQVVFNKEQYPTVFEKAAVYLRNIIGDHPFNDGNKRTAITVCVIFLERNEKYLITNPKDLETFTIKVVTNHLEITTIAEWLKIHTK